MMLIDKKLNNKSIYISPYSELTVNLKNKLDIHKVNFKGFLDKTKAGSGIPRFI
jgi:hypothetical protein